ncbi:MAG: hypothetical protein JXC32_05285, partial [Anaerolineae bacterium]|nr:hypothetical protein [Anaerolineae bacterium]
MREPGAKPGVLAPVGPARHADLCAFADAGLRLIHLRSHVNPARDVLKWRDAGASSVVLQLLSPQPAREPTSPQTFVNSFSQDIGDYLDVGVRAVEVHGEPNRADRGAGVSWQDGAAFGAWFAEVHRYLKARFGAEIRVGFPALAPPDAAHPEAGAAIAESTFLEQCRHALEAADWAALHVTWQTLAEMRDIEGGMRCLWRYFERFPAQRFIVTSFANVTRDLHPVARGQQYAEYLTLMAQYERVLGVAGFPLRSGDPHYGPLAWISAEGRPTETLAEIAARPRLPDPRRVQMSWPTDTRRYIQAFGDHPRAYHRRYQMTGGHNGVDLAVNAQKPESSPITAALEGTVTQVALDESGYG